MQVVPFTAVAREWRLVRCLSRKRSFVQLPQDSSRSLSRMQRQIQTTRRSGAFRTANLDGSPASFSIDEIEARRTAWSPMPHGSVSVY